MEVKSRYEVVSDLESKKRELIIEKDGLNKTLKGKKRQLKELERDIEDKKEEIAEFEESMESQKATVEELIVSIDESLERFSKIGSK